MRKIVSNLLLFLGVVCLLISLLLFFQRYNPGRLAFAFTPFEGQISSINSSQTPKQLLISELGINLKILPSNLQNGRWEATTGGVSYLTLSPLPGQKGNSILYGHNWPNLLGNLTKAKPGQEIFIKYDDNSTKKFVINYTLEVPPTQASILKNSTDVRVTIYTCSGFLDSKRFVVIATQSIL